MKKALIVLFVCFIGGFFVLNLALRDRGYSPIERRNLAQSPAFTVERMLSGAFESDAESYITDQFAFRDQWIALKALCVTLSGQRENNGVYVCGDTLIERVAPAQAERLEANARAINRLVSEADAPVYLTLLPTAACVWADKLPRGAPTADEAALFELIAGQTDAVYVDTLAALEAHRGEAVYYRTDHHWTSLGAYYGSAALLSALNLEIRDRDAFSPVAVTEDFRGTLYAKAPVRSVKPDQIELWVEDPGVSVACVEGSDTVPGSLYDMTKPHGDDPYAVFLGGNRPLTVIKTGREGQKLLIVRDSYADSEAPFLIDSFSEIHLIDLRYYRSGVAEYAKEHGIDLIVISYSIRNYLTDTNFHFM